MIKNVNSRGISVIAQIALIMYRLGERVLCYEPDPGKVSKIFPAIVNQVCVLPASLFYNMCCHQVGPEQRSFLVHFCGWGHRWDRWLCLDVVYLVYTSTSTSDPDP